MNADNANTYLSYVDLAYGCEVNGQGFIEGLDIDIREFNPFLSLVWTRDLLPCNNPLAPAEVARLYYIYSETGSERVRLFWKA